MQFSEVMFRAHFLRSALVLRLRQLILQFSVWYSLTSKVRMLV